MLAGRPKARQSSAHPVPKHSQEAGGRYGPAYVTSSASCHHRKLLSPLSCCEHKSGRRRVRNGPFGWVGVRGGQEKGAGRALGSTRTRFDSTPLICFPMIRYVVRERVVRIRRAQQRLRKGRARCLREQRCMRFGVGRGSPGCSTIPSGSARLGSTCPSGYPDRCGRAGQCSDGKFWSGTEPGSGSGSSGEQKRLATKRRRWGVHKAAGAAGGEAGRTFGGAMGYSSGKKSSNLKMPSARGWRGGGWDT